MFWHLVSFLLTPLAIYKTYNDLTLMDHRYIVNVEGVFTLFRLNLHSSTLCFLFFPYRNMAWCSVHTYSCMYNHRYVTVRCYMQNHPLPATRSPCPTTKCTTTVATTTAPTTSTTKPKQNKQETSGMISLFSHKLPSL